ncbi:hypothetical protein CVT26_009956 [Gymnopilus dilepis]|uniref:Uncharacterized protein n=1 Tax=Gymnopilus dilepis TaxID=231916 RepID=A0A409VL51_9AGAR|nr:hypothetical protein CVT26_009956 [Gymnopilus dilepis]
MFEHCIPDSDWIPFAKQAIRAALALSSVCRGWRNIAISTPQLWTTLAICLGTPRLLDHLGTIHDWLGRSKALPLTIYLDDSEDEYLEEDREPLETEDIYHEISQVADVLKLHSGRWESLSIFVPGQFLGAFGSTQEVSPVFRSLSLMTTDPTIPDNIADFRLADFKPRSVTLNSVCSDFLGIDWSALTQIYLSDLSIGSYLRLLQLAPSLQECRLTSFEFTSEDHGQIASDTITHSLLQELVFTFRDDSLVCIILDHVAFPALQKLRLAGSRLPMDALSSFFTRSSCQLTELHIFACCLDDHLLLHLLAQLPSLVELDIYPNFDDSYSPDLLFVWLSRIERPSGADHGLEEGTAVRHTFLPNLRTFKYTANPRIPFPWISFSDVFGPQRAWGNPLYRPLQSIHLTFPPQSSRPTAKMDKEVLPLLLAIKEAGIDLQIRYDQQDVLQALDART